MLNLFIFNLHILNIYFQVNIIVFLSEKRGKKIEDYCSCHMIKEPGNTMSAS